MSTENSNGNTPKVPVIDLPQDLADALVSQDPKRIFKVAGRHFTPVALGIVTQPPYSGGPLIGFEPKIGGVQCVMNGFCCTYFDVSTGKQVSKIMGLDDVVKLRFTCISAALAKGMQLADREAGERAMKQVPAVAGLLKDAGVPSN